LLKKMGSVQAPEQDAAKIRQTADFFDEVRDAFLKAVTQEALDRKHEPAVKEELRGVIARIVRGKIGRAGAMSVEEATKNIQDDILGYGPLTDLLADPEIEEIEVNRFDEIWIERNGRHSFCQDLRFQGETHLIRTMQRIVDDTGRRIDESFPMVDGRLPDGSRFNAVIPPISPRGAALTIRKFKTKLSVDALIANGTFPEKYLGFFRACVKARLNIMVTGATSTGKTNLLNMLSSFVEPTERIIVIEDTSELDIRQPNIVRLEARLPSAEGRGKITIRDLVINALRMRPDRIIVGEVRGAETLDMLQAMNTGHDGSMSTGHANSPEDMLTRLESMVLMGENIPPDAIRRQIAAAFDIVIHLQKFNETGERKIVRVTEVLDITNDRIQTKDLLVFERDLSQKGVIGQLRSVISGDSPVLARLKNHGY
jgi:pilus assembly protein CpaF